jgi:Putative auto-transporter adhesin, head GIN domain
MITRMKFVVPISIALGLTCAQSAVAAERSFSVLDFDRIEVAGNYIVSVRADRATTAKASGAPDALDRVLMETRGRTLTIRSIALTSSATSRDGTMPVSIKVTVPALSGARLQGNGSLSIAELRGPLAELVATGSGTLSVARATVDRLVVRQSGAGQVQLSGKVLSADMAAKGSGGIDATALAVSDLKLTASTSGTVRGQASRAAAITSTGTGLIDIMGKPACTVQNTGPGEVHCGN